jgi:hypothetical protein
MTQVTTKNLKRWLLRMIVCCALLVPPFALAFPGTAYAGGSTASDNFQRADGPLGSNWTDVSDGGMAISGDAAAGTASAGVSGDMWTANTFGSDQFSEFSLTSVQPTGTQWIGAMVRAQSGGQSAYVGFYYANNGSPELMLFKRQSGGWTQLGSTFASGALSSGTQLEVTAIGSTVSMLENGAQEITATDTSLTGGAPGLMSYGTGQAAAWSGGDAANTTYTVGGTVSGLSGTVVLQDNGGDSLSVTANGSFTFATPLAGGAPYNVTVSSYPSGQTCSVTGGRGNVAAANVTSVTVACQAGTPSTSASDNFQRADGPLGSNWTDITDGGMSISGDAATGTSGVSGDVWTANTFGNDQFSQITLTSTQLTGSQWIGGAVRSDNSGQDAYAGIYFWNNGSPELMLFKRQGGAWTQLGSAFASGALSAGTQIEVTAVGSAVSVLENGTTEISVTDTSLTSGAPGLMAYGTGQAAGWSGGNASSAPAGGGTGSGSTGSGGGTSSNGGTATPAVSYTVGGTVSGLSGTVALQDNGGSALSVTANGSFTFATSLASGASYNVTVSAYPSGQTCAVAGGTGTVASANVTSVAVTCQAATPVSSASDNFAQANGPLSPNWAGITDGAMAISGDAAVGTSSGLTGDVRVDGSYNSNQFSQITVTSTQLTGTQWIGAAVRVQSGGQNGYFGIYNWNNGSPELMLFLRNGGTWSQLGSSDSTAPLAAGTTLRVEAVGSTIALLAGGVQAVAVGDTTFTGGAPAIVANGTGQEGSWSGGTQGFQVNYISTDSTGVKTYDVISASDSDGPQPLRVLQPTSPASGVKHNFLFVLPVEPGLQNNFGDGMQVLQGLDAEDKYNLTIVEPSFGIDPWYADSPTSPAVQYDTFMTSELAPWVSQNLSTTGTEQSWLIGFSKSGIGGQDLILRHPGVFTLAASWDFPADMTTDTRFGSDSEAGYGTDANFQSNYELSKAFLDAHKAPFTSANRIWIGGYGLYQQDDSDYAALLTTEGIQHLTETPTQMSHTWTSGWVPLAMAGLYQDSLNLPS